MIEDIAIFLSNTIVPKLIDDFASLASSPIDGIALTEILHSRGINMRYLGKIATLCKERKNLDHLYVRNYYSIFPYFCVERKTVKLPFHHIFSGSETGGGGGGGGSSRGGGG